MGKEERYAQLFHAFQATVPRAATNSASRIAASLDSRHTLRDYRCRMATPEHSPPSRRLRSAARAERARLRRDLERRELRIARLGQELAEHEKAASDIRGRLDALAPFTDSDEPVTLSPEDPPLRAVVPKTGAGDVIPLDSYLRGSDIRIAAVRVLAATEAPTKPIHYTDWFRLFCEAGYGIVGQDPQASFLTQIGRSPLISRAEERGTYALDIDAPRRIRERLHLLHTELVGLHEGQQTIEEIATVAGRREELTAEVVKAESDLNEALASLEPGSDDDA